MGDGGEEPHEIDLDEARSRLAEMERMASMLEARLVLYQGALESIRNAAAKVLDS